jgi:hypothetical protein
VQKVGWLVGLIALGTGARGLWVWHQATYLPDWYTQPIALPQAAPVLSGSDVAQADARQALKLKLARQVISRPTNSSTSLGTAPDTAQSSSKLQVTHEVQLDPKTFSEFVISSIPQTPQSEVILPAIKAINTEIDAGQLKIGLVVDTAELPIEQLPEEMRSQLEHTLTTFPFLKNQEVYLSVVGQPRLESGQVFLGENAKVQIGGLKMDLTDVSEKIGLPVEVLEQKINLQLGQLNVQDIKFSQNTAVLSGNVN